MNVLLRLLNLACGKPLADEDDGQSRRLQLVISALVLSLAFALVWGIAIGVRSGPLMINNAWKVPLVIFLSSAFAVPAGLVTWKLSGAQCRATDLLLGFATGVFAGTLVLAVLGPVVALYYESSQWAGPVLAQGAIAIALLTGTIVFARGVMRRAEGDRRTLILPLGVFKVMQIATLLQLIALVSPILPERTHVDRGIDGLAMPFERR
jgi:hypothetical protein